MGDNLTIIDGLFISAIFMLLCTFQAGYQAKKFADNKTVNHFRHGIYYAIVCTVISLWFSKEFGWVIGLKIFGIGILVRAAFFDPILNIMREKPLWYNGSYDKEAWKKGSSWLDWIEHKIIHDLGHDSKLSIIYLKLIYLIVWLIYIIVIL
jgi:hypothetical protein